MINNMYFGNAPYGLEDHINRYHGNGANMLREADFAQPRALKDGDILSNGLQVQGKPFLAFNSSVGLNFINGPSRIVAPRLPLALKSERGGVLPMHLRVGQILQTGCVILDKPRPIDPVEWHDYQEEIGLMLTGGFEGHHIGVPSDLELAVFDEEYPPSPNTQLGAFALREALHMHEIARRHLPELGQLALKI